MQGAWSLANNSQKFELYTLLCKTRKAHAPRRSPLLPTPLFYIFAPISILLHFGCSKREHMHRASAITTDATPEFVDNLAKHNHRQAHTLRTLFDELDLDGGVLDKTILRPKVDTCFYTSQISSHTVRILQLPGTSNYSLCLCLPILPCLDCQ